MDGNITHVSHDINTKYQPLYSYILGLNRQRYIVFYSKNKYPFKYYDTTAFL